MKTTHYPRRRRRRNRTTQATINQRLREIWIDGFGFLPVAATEQQLEQTRIALKVLADDDLYWQRMKALTTLKARTEKLREELKKNTPKAKATA